MTSLIDIGRLGEEAVVDNLKRQGWSHFILHTRSGSVTDMQAKNPIGTMQLFQITTAALPHSPDDLSEADKVALFSRASNIGTVAFEVKVQLDEHNSVVRIDYIPL